VGYLLLFYTKKKKVIYHPKNPLTKLKLTHLLFFHD